MPLLDDSAMEIHTLAGTGYGYSATRVEELGATEYTEAVLVVDVSGSVSGFRDGLEAAVKAIVESCRQSPRADNLLVRLVTFDSRVNEIHGFMPLIQCPPGRYTGAIQIGGATSLYDGAVNGIRSAIDYAKNLRAQDYESNAIVFVITDGDDVCSKLTANDVKQAKDEAIQSEALESIKTILIGVNVSNPSISQYLSHFQATGGFDQYVELKDASPKTLAKLAGFASQSISATSQSLGTGGPSQNIDPNALTI